MKTRLPFAGFRTWVRLVLVVAVATSALCNAPRAFAQEAVPWRALFNGTDLSGWETYLTKPDAAWDVPGLDRDAATGKYLEKFGKNHDPLKVFTIATVDGGPVVHVSGQGFGVMTTKASFGNIHLRLQYKWGEKKWGSKLNSPRDCGLLYFVHGEPGFDHETWPRSVECQIQERDTGDLFALGTQITVKARVETVGGKKLYVYDPAGTPTLFIAEPPIGNRCVRLEDREKPHGEWNTVEVICFNGDTIHVVNGKVVMRLQNAQRLDARYGIPAPLTAGQIALQTEGAEVFYRGIEVREIKEVPAEFVEPVPAAVAPAPATSAPTLAPAPAPAKTGG